MSTDVLNAPIRVRPGTKAPDTTPEPYVPHPGFVMNPAPTGKYKFKFRLTEGIYIDHLGEKTAANQNGQRVFQVDKRKGVFPIIETDRDLSMYNGKFNGMKEKFARLNVDQDVIREVIDPTVRQAGETIQSYLARLNEVAASVKKQTEAVLKSVDAMTIEQLTEYAEGNEIDLKGAKSLEAVRKIVKTSLGA